LGFAIKRPAGLVGLDTVDGPLVEMDSEQKQRQKRVNILMPLKLLTCP
jgi:hypothetical protein